jgi:hypothetical protein
MTEGQNGTKLLQRLCHYLETNQTYYETTASTSIRHHVDHSPQQRRQQRRPQQKSVPNSGITLPLNAIVWLLQKYVHYCEQQDEGDDDDAANRDTSNHDDNYSNDNNTPNPTHDSYHTTRSDRASSSDPIHPQQCIINSTDSTSLHRTLFQTLQPLLRNCTNLRITSQPWSVDKTTTTVDDTCSATPTYTKTTTTRPVRSDVNPNAMTIRDVVRTNYETIRQNDAPITSSWMDVSVMDIQSHFTTCISSYLFPNLHTLWYDQIHNSDIVRALQYNSYSNNAPSTTGHWMEYFVCRTRNTALIPPQPSNNQLRVLRIDMSMDNNTTNSNNNRDRLHTNDTCTNQNKCDTSGQTKPAPTMNKTVTTIPTTNIHNEGTKPKWKTHLLHRGTTTTSTTNTIDTNTLILASLPPSTTFLRSPSLQIGIEEQHNPDDPLPRHCTSSNPDVDMRKKHAATKQSKRRSLLETATVASNAEPCQLEGSSFNGERTLMNESLLFPIDERNDDNEQCHSNDKLTFQPGPTFPNLTHLKYTTRTTLPKLLLHKQYPAVRSICISHSDIDTTDDVLLGFDQLYSLQDIDLSYNRITSMQNVHYQVGHIMTLNVSNNRLRTLDGIDRLYSLQTLRVEHNALSDLHHTASRLANLPLLKELYIIGNPCCCSLTPSSVSGQNDIRHKNETADQNRENHNKHSRTLSSYRVDIWSAFIARRLSKYYKTKEQWQQLTLRNVRDELIPKIDGIVPNKRQWHILRHRVFIPVDLPLHFRVCHDNTVTATHSCNLNAIPQPRNSASVLFKNEIVQRRDYTSRHKVRHIASSSDYYRLDENGKNLSTLLFDNLSLHSTPDPSFSMNDVVKAIQKQSETSIQFHVPPTITRCLPQSNGVVEDQENEVLDLDGIMNLDEVLNLDENIGQQYLDSIAPYSHASRKDNAFIVDDTIPLLAAHSNGMQSSDRKSNVVTSVELTPTRNPEVCNEISTDTTSCHDVNTSLAVDKTIRKESEFVLDEKSVGTSRRCESSTAGCNSVDASIICIVRQRS